MAERVTIQDIADALGVSRNTVSKAINNTGILAESTRQKVLKKAQEMGYKQFSFMELKEDDREDPQRKTFSEIPGKPGKIAILFPRMSWGAHFAVTMVDRFQHDFAALGYSVEMYSIMRSELEQKKLPSAFNHSSVDGILCVEMFDPAYCRMLSSLSVPLLLVDCPVCIFNGPVDADVLLMDNQTHIFEFIRSMKDQGMKKFGYVGDFRHCQSFYERYLAFRQSMHLWGLEDTSSILVQEDGISQEGYRLALEKAVSEINEVPDVFLCANDTIAIRLIHILEKKGLKVPDDVKICGFDDSPEAEIVTPRLTSIHIHSQAMGREACGLLYSRIKNPDLNYRTVYTETHLKFRESASGSV